MARKTKGLSGNAVSMQYAVVRSNMSQHRQILFKYIIQGICLYFHERHIILQRTTRCNDHIFLLFGVFLYGRRYITAVSLSVRQTALAPKLVFFGTFPNETPRSKLRGVEPSFGLNLYRQSASCPQHPADLRNTH